MPKPRYDEDENVSRHAAANADCCEEMEQKYGWNLLDIEPLESDIFEVDCVFEGNTEFPKSYYNADKEQKDDA